VALGTGFVRNYQNDVFLKTEVNIISLKIFSAVITILTCVGVILVFGGAERAQEIAFIVPLTLAVTTLFGYLTARLALAPARGALASQKEFVGNVAHELRTPLSIIKANIELLLLEKHNDAALNENLESSIEELDRISNIINNLLTLNVLIEPERTPFEQVDFGTLIRRVVAKTPRPPQERAVRIKVRVGPGCSVWANTSGLEQIASNILKNALEHTPAGEITLTADCDADGVFRFSVQDTGTGISQEDLFRVFEPFYRGDRARTRRGMTGSGLGLTIVSELVKLHKGRVGIRSAPNEGTTVTVTLPRGRHKLIGRKAREQASEVFADFWNGKHSH